MNRTVLKNATSNDDEPTQGWQYHSIIRMTNYSNEACNDVINWIFKRLSSNESKPKVIKKCLMVIKNVSDNGSINFCAEMARSANIIKKYITYKGKRDEMHGDSLNAAVRKTAKETISTIFTKVERMQKKQFSKKDFSTKSHLMSSTKITTSSQYTGMGSNSNVTYTSSVNKYQGIESPSSTHVKCTKSKWKMKLGIKNQCLCAECRRGRRIERYGSKSNEGLSSYNSGGGISSTGFGIGSGEGGGGGGGGYQSNFNPGYAPPQFNSLKIDDEEEKERERNEPEKNKTDSKSNWLSDKDVNNGFDDYTNEKRIVNKFTRGQMVKVKRSDIQKFVKNSKNVDHENLCHVLKNKLEGSNWKVRLKALIAIEALLEHGFESVSNFFSDDIDCIETQSQAPQRSVSSRASKIISLLNNENGGSVGNEKMEKKNSKIVKEESMINMGGGGTDVGKGRKKKESEKKVNVSIEELFGESRNDDVKSPESILTMFSNSNVSVEKKPKKKKKIIIQDDDDDEDDDMFKNMSVDEEEKNEKSIFRNTKKAEKPKKDDFIHFGESNDNLKKKVKEKRRKSDKFILDFFGDDLKQKAKALESPMSSPQISRKENDEIDDSLLFKVPLTQMRKKKVKVLSAPPKEKDSFEKLKDVILGEGEKKSQKVEIKKNDPFDFFN